MRKNRGFTLIELLIVIVIIGILAVIVVGLVATNNRNRANDVRAKSDMREIQTALEQYFVDNNQYPADLAALVPDYLAEAKTSPRNAAYTYTSDGTTYALTYELQNTRDPQGPTYTLNQKQ